MHTYDRQHHLMCRRLSKSIPITLQCAREPSYLIEDPCTWKTSHLHMKQQPPGRVSVTPEIYWTMPRPFPAELVRYFFKTLLNELPGSISTIIDCLLVCSEWHDLGSSILWRDLVVDNKFKMTQLVDNIGRYFLTQYRRHVRSLTLQSLSFTDASFAKYDRNLAKLVALADNVQTLFSKAQAATESADLCRHSDYDSACKATLLRSIPKLLSTSISQSSVIRIDLMGPPGALSV